MVSCRGEKGSILSSGVRRESSLLSASEVGQYIPNLSLGHASRSFMSWM